MIHKNRSLLVVATSLVGTLFTPGMILSDFDGNGLNYVEGGTGAPGIITGGPSGSYYRLLNNVNSLHNFLSFNSDELDPADDYSGWTEITFTMDFRMANIAADGFGINFLSTDVHGHSGVVMNTNGAGTGAEGVAERAFMPDAIGVGFRVYQGRNSTVTFDDGLLASDVPYTYDDGAWGSLEISITRNPVSKDTLIDVTTYDQRGLAGNAQVIHSDAEIQGLLIEDFRVQIGGRTGGLNMIFEFDNVEMEVATPDPSDNDGDGLPNEWEIAFGLDPEDNGLNPNNNGQVGDPDQGADGDPDLDSLTNAEELALGTNPVESDSDNDGLTDDVEDGGGVYVSSEQTGTSPILADSDRDGLTDGSEVPGEEFVDANQSGTNPNLKDSDGDGINDGVEIELGRNPTIEDVITPVPGLIADFDGNGEPFEDEAMRAGAKGSWVPATATSDGNYYQLLRNVGSTGNFISFEPSEDATGWQEFSFTMDYLAANTVADGFGINFLSTAVHGDSGVVPMDGGTVEERALINDSFGVGFRTYQGTNATVTWNAADLSGDTAYPLTQDRWASVGVDVTRDSNTQDALVDVTVYDEPGRQGNAQVVYDAFPIAALTLENFRVQIAARTGGAAMDLAIDNLRLVIDGGAPATIEISDVVAVLVPGTGGAPDTRSVTLTWNSQEGRTYAILASNDLAETNLALWDELDDAYPAAAGQETTTYTERGIPVGTSKRFYVIRLVE